MDSEAPPSTLNMPDGTDFTTIVIKHDFETCQNIKCDKTKKCERLEWNSESDFGLNKDTNASSHTATITRNL